MHLLGCDILLAWNLKKSCKRKQSLLLLLCLKQLQLIRRSFSLFVGKVISLLCQRFPQTFFLIIVAKSIFLFCNNVFNILAIRNNFLLERLSANREIGFLKKMLKWRVGKQLHWSFVWHKGGERLCGKPFVLKESAQYSSSFLATTLFAISRKKNWVNGRTFFWQQFHHFVLFASNFERSCDERFDDFLSNNLC